MTDRGSGRTDLMSSFTIVTDEGERDVDATRVGASVRIDPEALERVTGWKLEPEGLCRADVCIPVRDRASLVIDGLVDLEGFAQTLRRPLVVDAEADIAVLGASVADRSAERQGMRVPAELILRDLDGNEHRWAELGRKKKLLFAWASW
jgi:hypothetical protein